MALGLSLAGLAAMLGAVPLGKLGDRFGHRRVWVAVTVVQALAFAGYPFVRTFPVFLALATLAALAEVEDPRSVVPICPGSRGRSSAFALVPTTRPSRTQASRSVPWAPG